MEIPVRVLSIKEIPLNCEHCHKTCPTHVVTYGNEMGPDCDWDEYVCDTCLEDIEKEG